MGKVHEILVYNDRWKNFNNLVQVEMFILN